MDPASTSPMRWVIAGCAALVVWGAVVGSPTAVLGAPMGALAARHWLRATRRRHARQQSRTELIDLVDRMIQLLKGGGSLSAVIAEGGRRQQWPGQQRAGRQRTVQESEEERLLSTTLAVLVARGGPALPSLERLSDTLRSSRALGVETESQAGQATASALALALLPALFVVGLAAASAPLRNFYLFEPAGTFCLLSAACLSYGGWAVMQRLIESVR